MMSSAQPRLVNAVDLGLRAVLPLDSKFHQAALQRLDRLTKPLGALGRLEPIAAQLCAIQQTLTPRVLAPHVLVFAGDHGAADRGVSAYPKAVTAQMVANFVAGGAAINVLAQLHGLQLMVVDAGVDADFAGMPGVIDCKVARGTQDYVTAPAMSESEFRLAMTRGAAMADQAAASGATVLALGEMGIGNTGSAALLMHGLTGQPLEHCVGRGTGLDDEGVARKVAILRAARDRSPDVTAAADLLTQFGGFEIAMLVGCLLGGAAQRRVLLVDGFTVTVAAALAAAIEPHVLDYCVFGHRSAEHAHRALLSHLGVEPLLDLGMRLGEGTGAALAVTLVRSAAALIQDMATFESAGVSEKDSA
jgi:nicotinate-nucleotide--dimethylbenzimidazole phosphoribosyltransferase